MTGENVNAMWSNQIIDSRGREVPICPAGSLRKKTPKRVRRAIALAQMGSRRFALSFLLGIASGVLPLAILARAVDAPRELIITLAAGMLVVAPLILFGVWVGRHWRCEMAREAMLSIGLCPSCGYSLSSAATGSGVPTVCPECGAAWRLPSPPPSANSG
jgi:hypothetical protein